MSYRVVVVGATGNVGREILSTLAERKFPIKEIAAVASEKSSGMQVSFGDDQILHVQSLQDFNFEGYDIALFSAGSKAADKYAPIAAQAGCVVIDNSSRFRQESDVPLIVPEVNADALKNYTKRNIIANPNCVAIPLAMTLKPLQSEVKLKRVVVSTYQSTSGAGRKAMDELFNQTRAIFMNQPIKKEEFSKQIAFNLIPHIGDFATNGQTTEEIKVIEEVQKIVDPNLPVAVTCVRVPVFIGHSAAVTVEFESELSVGEARSLWREMPGLSILDQHHEEGYMTPAESTGEDEVFISRIRADKSVSYGLQYWVVSDNLRKGAALNAVQIAELLIQQR